MDNGVKTKFTQCVIIYWVLSLKVNGLIDHTGWKIKKPKENLLWQLFQ